jgi:putative thioredoxin
MNYEVNDIKTDIIDASQHTPVIIDFWAEWCGPCRVLGPVIEKLATQAKGRWKLVKVDLENPNNQPLAAQFQIRSIPAVRMIYQGKLLGEFNGALPESQIKQWLDAHLPKSDNANDDDDEELLLAAIESGDRNKSRKIALKQFNEDRENDELKIVLAMQILPDKLSEAEKLMESLQEPERFTIEQDVIKTIKHLWSVKKGKIELPDSDSARRYREAANNLFKERFDDSAEGFIQVLMADRSLDDDGARKACVALFRILGDKHPVSQTYRRRFSMALY